MTTLGELARVVGQPSEELREALFRRVPDAQLVEMGARIDSQCILDDVPGFVAAGLDVLKRLSAEQRGLLKLPPGLFALLVDETLLLVKIKRERDEQGEPDSDTKPAAREAQTKRAMREGLLLRNVALQALRTLLSREAMVEVERRVEGADSPARLVDGLQALTEVVRRLLGGDALDQLMAREFGLDDAFVVRLASEAASLQALASLPPPPELTVSQRRLDLQDGRVLHLLAIALRAFRAAHKVNALVEEPRLPASGWLFDATGSTSR